MSKQDEEYGIQLTLEVKPSSGSLKSFEKALADNLHSSDRVTVNTETKNGNLYISIKAKDTNILRSVVNNYLNAIKMLEETDKL